MLRPLRVLKSQGKLELLVPALIIEEFDRNRPRSEEAVTTSVLDRLRQLRRELREYAGDKHEHIWLAETAQHIPLVNATAPQNFREIDELLRAGTILEPGEPDSARAVQRGLGKPAPFTSDKNSVADALLIEIYASRISGTDGSRYAYEVEGAARGCCSSSSGISTWRSRAKWVPDQRGGAADAG